MKYSSFVIAVLLITGCAGKKTSNENSVSALNETLVRDYSNFKYVLKFKGTTRCADCPGIETTITFVNDNLTFFEESKYLERNVVVIDSGSYTTERGFMNDEDATVYVLHDDQKEKERRLLRWSDESLVSIDANGVVVDTSASYRLFKMD